MKVKILAKQSELTKRGQVEFTEKEAIDALMAIVPSSGTSPFERPIEIEGQQGWTQNAIITLVADEEGVFLNFNITWTKFGPLID